MWRHFVASLPAYDMVFAYRTHNLLDLERAGARRTAVLMPWFVPKYDHLVTGEPTAPRFDVVFAGHYEDDSRLEYLEALDAAGIEFGLFGPDWDRAPEMAWLRSHRPVQPVRGQHYYETLRSARIALCFFSKLNRDVYTRRSFEIPYSGTFMLSEYSDESAHLFRPGVDADYFTTPDELVRQVKRYLGDDALRRAIAMAGRQRVITGAHDLHSRAEQILAMYSEVA
jgi:spore maturation protein CgeB